MISFIGCAVYGCAFSYLLYYIFYFATIWSMGAGAIGILYALLFGIVLIFLVGGLSVVLFAPIFRMAVNDKYLGIPAAFLAYNGISSMICPWQTGTHGEPHLVFIAIIISIVALIIYISAISFLYIHR